MRLAVLLALAGVLEVLSTTAGEAAGPRWRIDAASGRWSLEGPRLALRGLATGAQVGGEWLEMGGGVRIAQPAPVRDGLGAGERIVATASAKAGVEFSLSITTYRTGCRALVEAHLRNVGGTPLALSELRAFRGGLATAGPARDCRMLINSGHQGTSGVFPLGAGGAQGSAYVTCLLDPAGKQAVGIGMVSYHRADAWLAARETGAREVEVSASASFSGIPIAPGASVSSEAFLVEWGEDPLRLLERYADALAALHHIRVSPDRTGFWNVWYAYSEAESTQDLLLKSAEYQGRHLLRWGFPWISPGIWQQDNAFGEERVKPDLFPKGLTALATAMRTHGVKLLGGGFLARVTETTPVFREHPEFVAHGPDGRPLMIAKDSWGNCPYPHYMLDITHPGAQEWYRRLWQHFREWGCEGYFVLDFEGTGPEGIRHDASLNAPFETDRLRLGLIRQVIGKDTHLGVYTSPTNRYLGLADRVRMASDIGGFHGGASWEHIRGVARNMAAAWFYHNRVWVNDPDPPMVGLHPEPSRLEEARVRLLLAAATGGFVTLGERMPEMDPAQFRLLSTILPPLADAARPVDLFRREVPEIQDRCVRTAWDTWHVVGVTNWDDPVRPEVRAEANSEAVAGNGEVYAALHAYDGNMGTALGAPSLCWAPDSREPPPHWISLAFLAPRDIQEVTIHWTNYRGFDPQVEWWTSTHYLIQAWQEGAWQTVEEVRNEVPVAGIAVTTHAFAPIRTERLRILQPEAGGPPRRPNMMAVGEIELSPGPTQNKEIRIDFAELGLKRETQYLVYEFWNQEFLGQAKNGITLSLAPHTSRVLCIRPVPKHPWILGTDLHYSQGGVELRDVKWRALSRSLEGVADRPEGSGRLVIYVPAGFAPRRVVVADHPEPFERVGADVVKLPVAFSGKPVRWRLSF